MVNTLENRVKDIEGKVQCNYLTESSPANTQSSPQVSVESRYNQITSMVNSLLNKEKEKSRCRLNLIFHNVKESTAEDGLTTKQQDIEVVSFLFEQHLGVSPTISRAFLLGQKHRKPRNLKITVTSDAEKATILRNSIKFHDQQKLHSNQAKFSMIIINRQSIIPKKVELGCVIDSVNPDI